jgi:hypothetical protein
MTMSDYHEDVTGFRWSDDWMNSALARLADEQRTVATRDVNSLTVGQLTQRSSDLPHRKREAVVIDGVAKHETLKQRLTREAKEAEQAILTLAGKLSRRQEQLKHLERFPDEDPFVDGTTLIFQKGFPSNPDQKYSYSAVRADGLYYVTGNRSPNGLAWDQFVNWMGLGVDEVYRVTPAKGSVKKVIG